MGRKATVIMPATRKALEQVGENIRLARLRRRLSVALVAERAGVSRSTVWAIEKGAPSVSMGAYAGVLLAIGLRDDLLKIAADDALGRALQDLDITPKKRAPKRGGSGGEELQVGERVFEVATPSLPDDSGGRESQNAEHLG